MDEVKEPVAFGSTDHVQEESERLLRERREKERQKAVPPATAGSPETLPPPKKKTTTKKPSEVTAEEVQGFSSLYTKLVGYFLPVKTPASKEEIEILDNGARGTFRKYPQVFAWFPFFMLLAGMALFVVNRLGRKGETSKPLVHSDSRDDGDGKVGTDRTNNPARTESSNL